MPLLDKPPVFKKADPSTAPKKRTEGEEKKS